MAKYTIKVTRDGRQLEKALTELTGKTVKIGYQQGWAESEDGVDECDIAAWNEFGTEKSPSRPFMRNAIDNHTDKIDNMFKAEVNNLQNGMSAEQILNQIGVFVKDLIQTEIVDGDFTPNAPYTIAKKGSSKPLIDTGRMRQSVQYIITERD